MPTDIQSEKDILPGDHYESCAALHPCLCIRVDGDEVHGISLVDGTYPRGCSIRDCGIRKLSLPEALHWKFFGPQDRVVDEKDRWWYDEPKEDWLEPYRLPGDKKI